ncbi:MAG: putative ABC transport system permease protein, partial [Planctomycetota bacterium]
RLAVAFLPVALVIGLLWHWRLDHRAALVAVGRMLLQLLLIGYVLVFLFEAQNGLVILGALSVMLLAASWIALGNLAGPFRILFPKSLAAIGLGGGAVLLVITQGVLGLDPWFDPSKIIPLAGMIFATSMNSVSLAGERMESEVAKGIGFVAARSIAMRASLIPITNSLLAVGLVSLPGMMTGQILSGVSPFIAARYQIMVMCMIFGAAGISAALFLTIARKELE